MLDVLHRELGDITDFKRSASRSKSARPSAESVGFRQLVTQNNRKQVAAKFYTLLVLKKLQAIDIRQEEAFGDIVIARGPMFDSVKWSVGPAQGGGPEQGGTVKLGVTVGDII